MENYCLNDFTKLVNILEKTNHQFNTIVLYNKFIASDSDWENDIMLNLNDENTLKVSSLIFNDTKNEIIEKLLNECIVLARRFNYQYLQLELLTNKQARLFAQKHGFVEQCNQTWLKKI